nr:BlaB/IND/MUS family subclass B1 metallo-beta-lactamase [Sphingobacterium haloxyli]
MFQQRKLKSYFAIIILYFLSISATQAQSSRTEWFEDARYGMFIHWGLYSAAEGMWKGEPLRYANNYAEWIRYRNRISKEEYGELAKRFVWDKIDPEDWVLLAKESGMKYIIITAKHHDGVALWNTKVGNYSLSKLSGANRDVIKEIADACRKHDMKLGFYYSHWIDWEHPYAWDHNQELTGHVTDEQFNQYWQEKAIPQMRELLTNYGDIAIMWFDMWIPYEKTIFKREQLEQAVALIRELQPNCLINSRLGLPTDANYVDFETLGDNQFGTSYIDHPWETPGTIAHSWGYNGQEKNWKSTGQLFESLISNVALNGGFTLNIGPRADGSVPYESISRLRDVGKWLNKYGEALYNNTGLDLQVNQHDWGKITKSRKSNTVYLHVFNWPLDGKLRLSGINSKPQKAELLSADGTRPLSFKQYGPLTHIQLPQQQSDPFVSVVRLTYDSIETVPSIVAESTFGGFALTGRNAQHKEKLQLIEEDYTRPAYVQTTGGKITWELYLPEAGVYHIDLSAHNPTKKNIVISIGISGNNLQAAITPNGKVVAEPNEDNYTDEFVDTPIGEITVEQAGRYKVEFQAKENQELWLNRIWIDKVEQNAYQTNAVAQAKPLVIEKINDKLYLYTTYQEYEGTKVSANALYLLTQKGAILFDTPWDATQYQPLLDSIQEKHGMPVIGVYATHWHEDRAGGFGYYNKVGIPTYATTRTNALLRANGKPLATRKIEEGKTYSIGGESFVFDFFGPGHSLDNVVVWFPKYKILDGGCFIKSADAKKLGFTGDGDVKAWKPAMARLLAHYPEINLVIPGHDDWKVSQKHIDNTFKLLDEER